MQFCPCWCNILYLIEKRAECQVDAFVSYWDTHRLSRTFSHLWLSRQQNRLSLTADISILVARWSTLIEQLWCEVNWLLKVTINDISVTHVTTDRCAGGLKKLDLQLGSKRHRHFVGFFNVPVRAPIWGQPFYSYSFLFTVPSLVSLRLTCFIHEVIWL